MGARVVVVTRSDLETLVDPCCCRAPWCVRVCTLTREVEEGRSATGCSFSSGVLSVFEAQRSFRSTTEMAIRLCPRGV